MAREDILLISNKDFIEKIYQNIFTHTEESQPYFQNLNALLKKGKINKKDSNYLVPPEVLLPSLIPKNFFLFFFMKK